MAEIIAVEVLAAGLRDPLLEVRLGAVAELAERGPAARAAVPALIGVLRRKHEDPSLVRQAADALGRIEPEQRYATNVLLLATRRDWLAPNARAALRRIAGVHPHAVRQALDHDDLEIRREAAEALLSARPEPDGAFLGLMDDPSAEVRRLAAAALKKSASPAYVPALARALGDSDFHVRVYAAEALVTLGPAAAPAIGSLVIALGAEATWGYAGKALVAIGAPALPATAAALDAAPTRYGAMRALAAFGAPAVALLIERLGSADAEVRAAAAEALQETATAAKPAEVALIAALTDADVRVRVLACQALAAMGSPSRASEPLIAALADPDATVREHAAEALGGVAPAMPAVIAALRAALEDDEAPARAAGRALAAIGEPALPVLLDALCSETAATRRLGACALGTLPSAERIAVALAGALRDEELEVRKAAAESLGSQPADVSMAALKVALGADPASDVRWRVARALGRIKAARSAPALASALSDGESIVRDQAASALGALGKEAACAVPALLRIVETCGDSSALDALVSILREIGRPAVVTVASLLTHRDWDVKTSAADLLGGLGPDAEEAVPALIAALEDHESGPYNGYTDSNAPALADFAEDALAKIGTRAALEAVPSVTRGRVLDVMRQAFPDRFESMRGRLWSWFEEFGSPGSGSRRCSACGRSTDRTRSVTPEGSRRPVRTRSRVARDAPAVLSCSGCLAEAVAISDPSAPVRDAIRVDVARALEAAGETDLLAVFEAIAARVPDLRREEEGGCDVCRKSAPSAVRIGPVRVCAPCLGSIPPA